MPPGTGIAIISTLFASYPLIHASRDPGYEIAADYMRPYDDDRQLTTLNLHLFLLKKTYAPWHLELHLGFTATHVSGNITQLTGSFEAGTLREVVLDSPANGFGPVAEARLPLLTYRGMSVSTDLLAAGLYYDRNFPAGGTRYDGLFQAGPTLSYSPSTHQTFRLGYRWMHVSNGQGLGPHNPGYDSRGFTLRYERAF